MKLTSQHCAYQPTDLTVATDVPANTTLFGISCNRQLSSAELLVRPSDVTRSMVQKAVVVIASQPVFVRHALMFSHTALMYRVLYGTQINIPGHAQN